MKKIIMIVMLVLLVVGGIGYFVVKSLFPDQVTLQYDKETISDYKRTLSFEGYDLDGFKERYEAMKPLVLEQTIESMQAALLEGQMTVEELAKFYVYRIRVFEDYNTVIALNPNLLDQARALDKKILNNEAKDLFGVLVLIKDNVADASMNTAAGAYVLRDLTTSRDAHLVASLKAEDALIIGKANLSEWSNYMSMPSSNGYSTLGGQTKNAYGKFDVGGSSSGSCAAEALNLATVTIGSETAGSLIYPAGQNSVVALKPSLGLISRDLIIPIAEAQDTAGVVGRNVEDVYKVFSRISKEDSQDAKTEVVSQMDYKTRLDKVKLGKIGLVDDGSPALKGIVKEFEAMGVDVVKISLASEQGIDMLSVLAHGIDKDLQAFLTNPAVKSPVDSLQDVVAFNKKNKDAMAFGQYYLEDALEKKQSDEAVEKIIAGNIEKSRKILDDAMAANGVEFILSISNNLSGIYAPAGYPALTLPSGYKADGEPYGLTLVGAYLSDVDLLEVGLMYENYTKHRKQVQE